MPSILKTVITFSLLLHLSSSAVLRRDDASTNVTDIGDFEDSQDDQDGEDVSDPTDSADAEEWHRRHPWWPVYPPWAHPHHHTHTVPHWGPKPTKSSAGPTVSPSIPILTGSSPLPTQTSTASETPPYHNSTSAIGATTALSTLTVVPVPGTTSESTPPTTLKTYTSKTRTPSVYSTAPPAMRPTATGTAPTGKPSGKPSTYNPITLPSSATKPSATYTTKPSSTPVGGGGSGSYWKPVAGLTWQIELSGQVTDLTNPAAVFDVDLFDTPDSTITALKAAGKKVICYFSAGSYENWRPDQASFTAADKGSAMEGWAGEWWLNTNSANVRSIMVKRIEMAKTKGCDAVDPDNVDGYDNKNGLSLQQTDAVNFVTFLAQEAHSRGMACGLKNAGSIVPSVVNIMEFHVNEECVQNHECDMYQPFIDAGKPVFHVEYPSGAPNVAASVKQTSCQAPSGFSSVLKTLDLSSWIEPC